MDRSSVRAFYDDLAADYHLLYPDWNAAVHRQGLALDRLIRRFLGDGPVTALDCACGIGTQALGLAQCGHRVTGTDLSPIAAGRASAEATRRGVRLSTAAADMRRLPFRDLLFDVVVCADNSIAHLLTAPDVAAALAAMRRVLRPAGLLLLTTRSDHVREVHPTTSPLQVTDTPAGPVITFQLWAWHDDGERYDLEHIQLHPHDDGWQVRVRRTTSWAMTQQQVSEFVTAAGFNQLGWHDATSTGFLHPVLTARVPGD